jgi:hypothetical protein
MHVLAGAHVLSGTPDHLAVLVHQRPLGQVAEGDLVAGGHV